MCVLFFSGCSHKKASDYEKELKEIYTNHGLSGDIAIESIKNVGYFYTTVQTQVDFNYIEKIEGKDIKVEDSALFEKNTTKIVTDPKELNQTSLIGIDIFSGVVQSFEQQQAFLKLKDKIEKEINQNVVSKEIQIHKIAPYLATFERTFPEDVSEDFPEAFSSYQQEVKRNEEADLGFKGYFDIDIKENMKTGLISVHIGLDHITKEMHSGDDRVITNRIFSRLLKMDTSQFYDGYYEVSYDNRTKDGSVGGGGETIHFWIEEGKKKKLKIGTLFGEN